MMDELDDSFEDPDYKEDKLDSDVDMFDMTDEENQEDVTMEDVRRKEKPQAEIRVYMDPPVERGDGDTDKDSGDIFIYLLHWLQAQSGTIQYVHTYTVLNSTQTILLSVTCWFDELCFLIF
jgi:hypothetical protein